MKRKGHSATVLSSTPTLVEIFVFGGCTRDTYGTYCVYSTHTLLILGEFL